MSRWRVNIDFHSKFWHSAREKLRGTTRGMYRMCEVVVERYRSYLLWRDRFKSYDWFSPYLMHTISKFANIITHGYNVCRLKIREEWLTVMINA